MKKIVIVLAIAVVSLCGCDSMPDWFPQGLTPDQIVEGLQTALDIGANNSLTEAHKENGFLNNPIMDIRIPLPAEVQNVVNAVSFLYNMSDGLKLAASVIIGELNVEQLAQDFLVGINRAAEAAAGGAFRVFTEAIWGMDIADGLAILNGADTAATAYLRTHTTEGLRGVFLPIVADAMLNVEVVTRYWEPLVTNYNSFYNGINGLLSNPLVSMVPALTAELNGHLSNLPAPIGETNFDNYITSRAIHGLMSLIGDQEMKIRADPFAWGNDIIEKVFGSNRN